MINRKKVKPVDSQPLKEGIECPHIMNRRRRDLVGVHRGGRSELVKSQNSTHTPHCELHDTIVPSPTRISRGPLGATSVRMIYLEPVH